MTLHAGYAGGNIQPCNQYAHQKNQHNVQVCKQITCKLLVLAFLTMRLGTLVHTTLMPKPHLQVRKQQQIASGQ